MSPLRTLVLVSLLSLLANPWAAAQAAEVSVERVEAYTLREVRIEPHETMPLGVVMGVRSGDRDMVVRVRAAVNVLWAEGEKTLRLTEVEQLRIEGSGGSHAPLGEFKPFPQVHGPEGLFLRRGDATETTHDLDLVFVVPRDEPAPTLVLSDVRTPLEIVDQRREASFASVVDVRVLSTAWHDAVKGPDLGAAGPPESSIRSPFGPLLEVEYELTPRATYGPAEDSFRWRPMSLGLRASSGAYSSCVGSLVAGAVDTGARLQCERDGEGRWQSVRSRCVFAAPAATESFDLLFAGDVVAHGDAGHSAAAAQQVTNAAQRSNLVPLRQLDQIPPYIGWAGVAAVLPRWVDRVDLPETAGSNLHSAPLAPDSTLLRVQYGAFEHSLLHVGSDGTVFDVHHVTTRGQAYTADLDSDGHLEVLLETIEGDALSIYPATWRVLRAGDDRKLTEVLAVPRSLSFQDGRDERFCLLNHIEFHVDGGVEIQNISFDPACLEAALQMESPWPPGTPGWPSRSMDRWWLELESASSSP